MTADIADNVNSDVTTDIVDNVNNDVTTDIATSSDDVTNDLSGNKCKRFKHGKLEDLDLEPCNRKLSFTNLNSSRDASELRITL